MSSSSVSMRLEWRPPPGELRSITNVLHGLMVATRVEHGCISCSVSSEMGAGVIVQYVEEWATEDDLKRQLRSSRFTVLAELMELAVEPPSITFLTPGATRGLDYATNVRQIDDFDSLHIEDSR